MKIGESIPDDILKLVITPYIEIPADKLDPFNFNVVFGTKTQSINGYDAFFKIILNTKTSSVNKLLLFNALLENRNTIMNKQMEGCSIDKYRYIILPEDRARLINGLKRNLLFDYINNFDINIYLIRLLVSGFATKKGITNATVFNEDPTAIKKYCMDGKDDNYDFIRFFILYIIFIEYNINDSTDDNIKIKTIKNFKKFVYYNFKSLYENQTYYNANDDSNIIKYLTYVNQYLENPPLEDLILNEKFEEIEKTQADIQSHYNSIIGDIKFYPVKDEKGFYEKLELEFNPETKTVNPYTLYINNNIFKEYYNNDKMIPIIPLTHFPDPDTQPTSTSGGKKRSVRKSTKKSTKVSTKVSTKDSKMGGKSESSKKRSDSRKSDSRKSATKSSRSRSKSAGSRKSSSAKKSTKKPTKKSTK